MISPPRPPRLFPSLLILTLAGSTVAARDAAPAPTSQPASHPASLARPRVMLNPDDLPRLQARCGIKPLPGASEPFAAYAADFQRIQTWTDANVDLPLEEGSLYLPAFMHLMTGQRGRPDKYSRCVERSLASRRSVVVDFDDDAAALDWCWDALDAATRQAFARRLLDQLNALTPQDSPLEHYIFHPKLCHLAAAIALQDVWLPDSPEQRRVQRVLDEARTYFDKSLPIYLKQLHGLSPVIALKADFEADLTYATELWHKHAGGVYWPTIAPLLNHTFDEYFWTQTDWPKITSPFIHDFGYPHGSSPGNGGSALVTGMCEILAHRTRDPLAVWYANILAESSNNDSPRELNRRWLHILHAGHDAQAVDRLEAPLARNLGNGWIIMRSDWRPGATVVAFDAGQPFWLNRQHYDAGQFQIIRKGLLALDSGDDVSAEAVPARGGAQGIGPSTGRFEDYASSTVAHNCVLMADPRVRLKRNGRNWPAPGNQRLLEGDFKPLDEKIESTDRLTGRLLAFETNKYYSYAAADLARAYPPKTALLYDRHLLFVGGRYLFVIDRIVTERPDTRTTWLLHLPSRPRLGAVDLDPQFRRRGLSNSAGTWIYPPSSQWIQSDGGEGRLLVRTLMPEARRVAFVGGPQTVNKIPEGRARGRSYVGSDSKGFEYFLAPASSLLATNAWFKLGSPEEIAPAFGAGANWGRMEIESTEKNAETLFINLLVPMDHTDAPPTFDEPRIDNGVLTITLPGADDLTYDITLSPRAAEPGRVKVRRADKIELDQPLAKKIRPDAPLPVR